MAVVLETLPVAGAGFVNNATSADASGGETIVAAVAGESHYITSIAITCISAITVAIQDDTGTPVVILGPVPFNTTAAPFVIDYPNPVKVAAGKLVEVKASGAGVVDVVIQGYTR